MYLRRLHVAQADLPLRVLAPSPDLTRDRDRHRMVVPRRDKGCHHKHKIPGSGGMNERSRLERKDYEREDSPTGTKRSWSMRSAFHRFSQSAWPVEPPMPHE